MEGYKPNMKLMEPSFGPWQPQRDRSRQIAVLMSGGVDSSVTAHLLRQQGWDVLGVTMKIPVSCEANVRGCCGADAAFVCNELGIAHYFVDVTTDFEKLIIERFRQSYGRGETPNPCVDCNTILKFALLWDFLEEEFGIRHLATGHYARVSETAGRTYLGRAKDKTKDQSYFLYGIDSGRLPGFVLPLGEMTKEQVRSTARELNLTVAEKAESMELCFAGEGDYRAALIGAEADRAGDITDMQGNKIGTHKGIANYTLGQRKGIGFAGGIPLYVGRIDAGANTIALGTREEISFSTVRANRVNTLIPEELVAASSVFGKIRSYGDPVPCRITDVGADDMTVEFDEPQFAPCPGQRLVLYNEDDNIIAGGTIFSD
ncbi:MAG: tRNA 2-thiouridine(34) synthase MnmA [Planctomycetota bacterium]|jgi:tRNA-specific 2-thiouridylase